MPLNEKGQKIMKSMKKQYGSKRGEQVFYASLNKGKIKRVKKKTKRA
jgi:Ni,Fe-hydrogenase III large subunit|tara:strand:+ start:393 stop:533 length:141 start_codon:yes stop_codon:yes gene_type:complete